ncbi:unnamed protein product, partial [marine sediment metagenome]
NGDYEIWGWCLFQTGVNLVWEPGFAEWSWDQVNATIIGCRAVEINSAYWTVGDETYDDFSTIQDALSSTSVTNGDAIIVRFREGMYYENIDFNGKNVILRSLQPTNHSVADATRIIGSTNPTSATVTFAGTEDNTCSLWGFRITGGGSSVTLGGGIQGNGAAANIEHNVIQGNAALDGGAIHNCDGIVNACRIYINDAEDDGGALYGCDGGIANCIIHSNEAGDDGGGLCDCEANIVSNTIYGNHAGGDGGGLADCIGGDTAI